MLLETIPVAPMRALLARVRARGPRALALPWEFLQFGLLLWLRLRALPPLWDGGAAWLHGLTEAALCAGALATARVVLLGPGRFAHLGSGVVAGLVLLGHDPGPAPLRDALVLALLVTAAWRGPDQEFAHAAA